MGTKMPGGQLLAALHAGMERIKMCMKVVRAANKKPQNRSNTDVNHILAETQALQFLTQHGPGVHRDLCHVVQHCSLGQLSSFRLPGEHPHGLFIYVMQGRIQVRTRSQYKAALSADDNSGAKGKSTAGGSSAGAADGSNKAAAASEADLRALFDSIDVDGSGAIDVEELQYALEVMGIQKTNAEIQELMDSVDKDGSGELEFDEFVLILTTKLGVGQQKQCSWQELADGAWALEVGQGGSIGAAALMQGLAQEGVILALEDADLLLLGGNVYSSILSTGFDGQLTAKVDILRSCPVLRRSLSGRSDLRGLAYVAQTEMYSWGSRVYAAGQPCAKGAVYIIQEGSCRIVGKVKGAAATPIAAAISARMLAAAAEERGGGGGPSRRSLDSSSAAAAAMLAAPRHGLHTARARVSEQQVELAVVGPGDIIGEAALLGLATHPSAAVVASAHLSALKLQLTDMQQLMHPADLQALQEALRQRDAERSQRLTAAASTASTLHMQSQHVRDVAAAATAAAAAAAGAGADALQAASAASSLLQDQQQANRRHSLSIAREQQQDGGEQGRPPIGTPRKAATASSSGRGSQAAVRGEAAMRQLLPSTGAAAAAAITACGEIDPASLPSRVARAEAGAVGQVLLNDLVGAKEDMQAAQEAVIAATAAALSAAGQLSDGTNGSTTARSGMGLTAAGSTAASRPAASTPGAGQRRDMHEATTAASAAAAAASASAPGAVAGAAGLRQQQGEPRFTAANVLLPDRVMAKLQAAMLSASQAGHRQSTRTCQRQHQQQQLSARLSPTSAQGSARATGSPPAVLSARGRTEGGAPGSKCADSNTSCQQRRRSDGSMSSPCYSPAPATAPGIGGAVGRGCHSQGAWPQLQPHCEPQAQQLLQQQQQQQGHNRQPSPPSMLASRRISRGLAVSPSCSSSQPDKFFLQTGGACVGAGLQGRRSFEVAQGQQQQQHGSLAGWGAERCSRSRTQEDQPGGSVFLTSAAPAVSLPVLAPEAVALAQQQLASGSISLPSPRSSRLRGGARTSCSPRSAAGAAVSVVAVALTAEAAANGAEQPGRREFGSAAPWLRRSKLQSVAVAAAAQSLAGRSSIGGSQLQGGSLAALPASCPSSARDIRVSQLFSTYVGAPGGRQSASPVQGQTTPRLWAAGASSSIVQQQPGTPWNAAADLPGREISLNGQVGGGSSSRAVTADAVSVAHCSPARPMHGGVFVELDGPAWDAAESAADAASWCLTSRSSRNSRVQPVQPVQQQAAASPRQRQQSPHRSGERGAAATTAAALLSSREVMMSANGEAAGGLPDAEALLTAARQLLEQPLPPGSLGSGCRLVSSSSVEPLTDSPAVLQQDGGVGLHCDQQLSGASQQLQQQQQGVTAASTVNAAPARQCSAGSRNLTGPASRRSLGRSSVRPGSVPKLQLSTLHMSLQPGTEVSMSPSASSPQHCSPAFSGSCRGGSPKSAAGAVVAGCISSPREVDQNRSTSRESALLPPVLPAFTPRRKWVPGGSLSRSAAGVSP